MENPVSLNGFIQIALVVKDMELALDSWGEILNTERPKVRINGPDRPNEIYRGKQAHYSMKFAIIDCKERGFVIELHEPDENPSTFREFLNKHGNGVHHIGFKAGDKCNAVLSELEALGYVMRNTTKNNGWTIVDGEDTLGVNLNIKPLK